MIMSDFCEAYQLSAAIKNKLTEDGYTHARMLRFVTVCELKEMSFRKGEMACLKNAVEHRCLDTAEE